MSGAVNPGLVQAQENLASRETTSLSPPDQMGAWLDRKLAEAAPPAALDDKALPDMGAWLDKKLEDQATQGRWVLEKAMMENPDIAAERKRISEMTGLPSDVVDRNIERLKVQERAYAIDLFEMAKTSPVMAQKLTNPDFAGIVHDDIPTMAELENRWRGFGSLREYKGPEATTMNIISGLLKVVPQSATSSIAGIKGSMRDAFERLGIFQQREPWQVAMQNRDMAQAEGASTYTRPHFDSAWADALYGAGESMIQMGMGAAVGAVFGAPTVGILPSMGVMTFGQSYAKFRGRGATALQAGAGAVSDAAVEVLTEMIPVGFLAKGFGKSGAGQALMKYMVSELGGEQVATILQDMTDTAIANPDKTWEQYWAERPEAAYRTLLTTLFMGGMVGGMHAGVRQFAKMSGQADEAIVNADTLRGLLNLAAKSKTLVRDRGTFHSTLEEISDGEEVFLDAEVLNQLPPEIIQQLSGVTEELQQSGIYDAIPVKVTDLVTALAGTPQAETVLMNVRKSPDSPNATEAQDVNARMQELLLQTGERIAQQAEDQVAYLQQLKTVQDHYSAEIQATGRHTKAEADNLAFVQATALAVMGHKIGLSPEEAFQKYGPQIGTAADGVGLTQPGQIDTPAFRNWFGDSKVVGEDGRPLVVYHGTNARFTEFRGASFFTPSSELAGGYGDAGEFYLSIKNLASGSDVIRVAQELPGWYDDLEGEYPGIVFQQVAGVQAALEAEGFDGAQFDDGPSAESDAPDAPTYVAFRPEQIKSATDNAGTFDPNDPSVLRQSATYDTQADGLRSDLESAGADVQDVMPIDALVDSNMVPIITLQDLVGLKIFPTIADRTAAAAIYTGIDSAQLKVAIPLLGGPLYPLRQSNWFSRIVWANRGKGVTTSKGKKVSEGARYMMILMGDANMHRSNTTVANAFFGTLESYAANGRISKENGDALTELVRRAGSVDPSIQKALSEFPGVSNVERLDAYLHAISFEARKRLLDILGSKAAQEHGAPSLTQILDATRENSLAGLRWGDGVLVVEIDETAPMVPLGEQGTTHHPDFPLGIRGKVVGRLQAPVNYELLWADWLSESRNAASARDTKTGRSNPRRAFELARPTVEITQELVDSIGPIVQHNVDSPRQARLAVDFAANNWRTSDIAKNKGGVSPQEFLDAISNSAAKDTLTNYTLQEVNAGIKAGTFKIYQLGEGQIFFAIKTLPDGKKTLVSMVNNEPGARGIGAPAVVLKALEEGVTNLDAYGVQSPKFPKGFLPALYGAFGFRVTDTYAFDPQYFHEGLTDEQRRTKLADAVKYWKDSTPGFDPAQGMPPLVEMEWQGTEDDRANLVQRYLRSGLEGLLAGGIDPDARSAKSELAALNRQTAEERPDAADAGGVAGDQGASAGASIASSARRTVAGVADLTDNELTNLGLTQEDRSAVQRALGRTGGDVLAQTPAQNAPPLGTFNPEKLLITLREGANLSTYMHEMGHWYLEVLERIALSPDAPAEMAQDWATVLKWGKVTQEQWTAWKAEYQATGKLPAGMVALHEKFAETFEAYLFTGKAPGIEMQSAFRKFKDWLTSVYKSLEGFLRARGIELDPEITGVFNRMLATEQQIAEAEQAAGLLPDVDATAEALEKLTARSLRDMKWTVNARNRLVAKMQKEVDGLRKDIEEEVRAEVEREPVYAAWRFFRYGVLPDDHQANNRQRAALESRAGDSTKLDLEALKAMYEDNAAAPWRYLVDQRVAANGGMNPEDAALVFGFTSGDHLVRDLLAADPIEVEIQRRAEQRSLERHGEMPTQEHLVAAANAAIHNEARARSLATEFAAQQAALNARADTGQTRADGSRRTVNVLMAAVKKYAEDMAAQIKIRDIGKAITRHTAAEKRAGEAWAKATAAGKTEEAIQAKRDQMLHHGVVKALNDAQERADKMRAYFKRFDKASIRKNITPDYLEQIDDLLEKIDLRQVSRRASEKRASLAQWIRSQQDQGITPDIPEHIADGASLTPFADMTMDELNPVYAAVQNIEHLGKLKNILLTSKKHREFMKAIEAWISEIVENGGTPRRVDLEIDSTLKKGAKNWWHGHRKVNSLVRQMAGYKHNSVGFDLMVRSMNDNGAREAGMSEKASRAMAKIYDPISSLPGGFQGAKVFIQALGTSLSRGVRLSIVLNMGNETNLQRLNGGLDKFSKEQLDAVVATLSPQELQFVNQVWEYLDTYWPEVAQLEKDINGKAPEKVEAIPFNAVSNTGEVIQMRGGYYPIVYDPRRGGADLKARADEEMNDARTGRAFTSMTRHGHVKQRASETKLPLLYDPAIPFRHVNQVIHDLAWRRWLIDVNRLFRNKDLERTITEYYGDTFLAQFRSAIDAIATDQARDMTPTETFLYMARGNVGRAVMGWSATTSLLQPFGILNAVPMVGGKYILKGTARMLGGAMTLENTAGWIAERSEMMRTRFLTLNRDINEIQQRVRGRWKLAQTFDNSLFYLISKMQMVADIPTWLGEYERALTEDGVDEETAAALADEAVLSTQGAGQMKDLAAVQRDLPFLTQFYSYFSATVNQVIERTGRTNFKNPAAAAGWMAEMASLAVLPAIGPALITHLLQGGDPDDDALKWAKRLANWQLSYLMGMFVYVREASAIMGAFDYAGPPAGRIVGDLFRARRQIGQGEIDDPLILSIVQLMGTTFGLPITQAIRSYKGWVSWSEGKAPPTSLIFGPPRKD